MEKYTDSQLIDRLRNRVDTLEGVLALVLWHLKQIRDAPDELDGALKKIGHHPSGMRMDPGDRYLNEIHD